MRLPAVTLVLSALLLAGCSDDGTPTPTATPTPTPTVTALSGDPFEALDPPTSPGVGTFDPILANRAHEATRGFLALQLLEKPTILGDNNAELVTQLQGGAQDPDIARDLGGAPTRRGLDYRPLFPAGTMVPSPVATVTSSSYVAEEVRGAAGEQGLRITWTGSLTYPVTLAGKASTITYALTTGYVFARVANDPVGLTMQQTVRGTATAEGVITACLAKGLLYPGPAAAACPA